MVDINQKIQWFRYLSWCNVQSNLMHLRFYCNMKVEFFSDPNGKLYFGGKKTIKVIRRNQI